MRSSVKVESLEVLERCIVEMLESYEGEVDEDWFAPDRARLADVRGQLAVARATAELSHRQEMLEKC